MEFLNNILKKNFDVKDTGRVDGILNPNHVDLDLYYPIGWSNSQTHILHIKIISLSTNYPISFFPYLVIIN